MKRMLGRSGSGSVAFCLIWTMAMLEFCAGRFCRWQSTQHVSYTIKPAWLSELTNGPGTNRNRYSTNRTVAHCNPNPEMNDFKP